MRQASRIPTFQPWIDYLMAWLDRRAADMIDIAALGTLKIQDDPEAIFQEGWLLCDAASTRPGSATPARRSRRATSSPRRSRAARSSTRCASNPGFQALLAEAEAGPPRALAAFREAGGERLLGGVMKTLAQRRAETSARAARQRPA